MPDVINAPNVWKFGDDIDTDLMLPSSALWKNQQERARAVFQANRPGWVDEVQAGDAIIAGSNFGTGSSRPAALSLRTCGVSCLMAESINSLFFRNAVNYGFPAFEAPGVVKAFEEGDGLQLSLETWTVQNLRTGVKLGVKPVPPALLSLMMHGGIVPVLQHEGLIADTPQQHIPVVTNSSKH